jgi:hypothetical protein
MTDEYSDGGSRIYRYGDRDRRSAQPKTTCRHLHLIEAHVERFVGMVDGTFHEIISDLVHLDILLVPPNARKPYITLLTSGASDLPMTVPEGYEEYRYAEYLINLPPEWPLASDALRDEANYWPIRWLKTLGRLPHEYGTWLGWGHTVPNGDPPVPIADTMFAGMLVLPPYWLDKGFFQLSSGLGYKITFYNVVPLYREEIELKLRKGTEALEKRLEQIKAFELLDVGRSNTCKKFWSR